MERTNDIITSRGFYVKNTVGSEFPRLDKGENTWVRAFECNFSEQIIQMIFLSESFVLVAS